MRARELRAAGFDARFAGKHASDALAGFTLGVLHLRWQACKDDPGGLSPEQFNTAQAWTRIVHRHAAIMGYSLTIRTPSFIMVGGGVSCLAEPEEQEITSVRRRWSDCYNALMAAARDHGMRVPVVTYGVCVENWPPLALSHRGFRASPHRARCDREGGVNPTSAFLASANSCVTIFVDGSIHYKRSSDCSEEHHFSFYGMDFERYYFPRNQMKKPAAQSRSRPDAAPKEGAVVTKATLRAADRLEIRNNALGKIVGVSGPTVSRMRQGSYVLDSGDKAYELALLFVRLYRSLDSIVDGDDAVAKDWINNTNLALRGRPIDLIQSVSGLTYVIQYLDSRRALS